ncbi:MAG: hypothetical protein H2172_03310 [Opitutus sp.]|nr:hypothetical protein [Opitutus sp.]MCS6246141.1 hypothetical protein [Opitutus sp.]MCS6273826.1 hypothetical protein [Opitutus sp.]MCS6277850.1 hypothetical protein [Opitutus sp.]MCS6299044.1 hypothetical protein [Opitutus sp.]
MNDRRFTELLNLYLDHQITAAEAAELEAAVHSSPARRRTYEEYCALQRACSQLGSNARACAPIAPRFARSVQDVERKITAPRRAHRWYPLQLGGLATLAMAAGFALVIILNQAPQSDPASVARNPALAAVQSAPVLVAAGSPRQPEVVVVTPFTVHPSLVAIGLAAAQNADDSQVAGPDREALEWMQRVDQLPRSTLVLDEQAFTARTMVPVDTHVFKRPHSLQNSAEFTGFQLSR